MSAVVHRPVRRRSLAGLALLSSILLAAYLPILMMASMSLRESGSIYANFWAPPWPLHPANYANAFSVLFWPALNTLLLCAITVGGVLFLSTVSGYAFARMKFPGRSILFGVVMVLMMTPATLLLTPNYVLAMKLGLRDTYAGLWLFYVSSGQVMGIFLMRSFFAALPEELFESARLDGASEWQCIWRIAVPLCWPILVTVAITTTLFVYNDLIWPMLMINNPDRETLMQALLRFIPADREATGRTDLGAVTAGYVFASIPILVIFWLGMKSYIRGTLSGAVKG
ncbi:MAG: carbohydrate transporter permease [Verrucomicrobia bacterium]|nr:carbohydrate transporter permease [Verrucomicrobiota bacterium]